jgi:hypothetical protein
MQLDTLRFAVLAKSSSYKDLQTCKREESNWEGADWRKNNLGSTLKQEFSDPIGEAHRALVEALES